MAKEILDQKQLDAAEEQSAKSSSMTYTHTFKTPFVFEGETYTDITFDWSRLTGHDSLAIENELSKLGKMVAVPALSADYLIRMAARASDPEIGADMMLEMPLSDFNAIRSAARSFLLRSER